MTKLSQLTTRVTVPISGQTIPIVVTPDGGSTGTGLIAVEDLAFSTLIQEAIDAFLRSGELVAGSGIQLDFSDPSKITIISTSSASYTAENARNDVGAALRGDTGFLDVTLDDVGNLINLALSATVKGRISTLENARSLIQVKDTLSSGGGTGNYMNLPGGAGNYVSTPSNAAYNFAGDMGVAVRVKMPSSAPAGTITLAARWGSSNAFGSWRFQLRNTGQMEFVSTVDGVAQSAPITTAATPLAFDGNWIWLRATRQSSTGNVDFYTAPDTGSNTFPTTWTTFQLNRATTAGVLWNNAGALSVTLSIGAYNAGSATEIFTGQIGRVTVFSGELMTDTVVADANASDWTSGTTWTGSAGRVWTLNGTATIVVGGSVGVYNTAAEFTLCETDANAAIPVAYHDTLLESMEGTFINTSGSAVNFTPKLRMAGVDLFTFSAISIPSTAAGQVYNWSCAVRIEVNASDGTTQIARAQMIVNNNVTGTDAGASVMASNLANVSGNRSGAIATITSIPNIQLKLTMATAAATIGARSLLTQLFIAKG